MNGASVCMMHGRYLQADRAGRSQLLDEIEEAMKRYFALGVEAKPHVLCPDCRDEGAKGCKGCGQAGYLTKPQWAERQKGGRR